MLCLPQNGEFDDDDNDNDGLLVASMFFCWIQLDDGCQVVDSCNPSQKLMLPKIAIEMDCILSLRTTSEKIQNHF